MSDQYPTIALRTVSDVQAQLGARLRGLRLRAGWKQATLALRSGVSVATIKRVERDGQATLGNLLRVSQALGVLDEFAALCDPPPPQTLAMLERNRTATAQRGRQ